MSTKWFWKLVHTKYGHEYPDKYYTSDSYEAVHARAEAELIDLFPVCKVQSYMYHDWTSQFRLYYEGDTDFHYEFSLQLFTPEEVWYDTQYEHS